MTVTTTGAPAAIHRLQEILGRPRRPGGDPGGPTREVRRRLATLRDALRGEVDAPGAGSFAAREDSLLRERDALLRRLGALEPLETLDDAQVRHRLERLVADAAHHLQRLHDLAYDEVELELGGSE